jgi:hypothetical protein
MTYDKYILARRDYEMACEMFPERAAPKWDELTTEQKDNVLAQTQAYQRKMDAFGKALATGQPLPSLTD